MGLCSWTAEFPRLDLALPEDVRVTGIIVDFARLACLMRCFDESRRTNILWPVFAVLLIEEE